MQEYIDKHNENENQALDDGSGINIIKSDGTCITTLMCAHNIERKNSKNGKVTFLTILGSNRHFYQSFPIFNIPTRFTSEDDLIKRCLNKVVAVTLQYTLKYNNWKINNIIVVEE